MYKFDPHGEPVDAAFRAIALDQLDETLADLNAPPEPGRSVVHEARRRCKKLRGLLRLVRPAFAEFEQENRAIRDAAKTLSHLRDGEVLHETIAALHKWRPDPLLARLAGQSLASPVHVDGAAALADFKNRIEQIRSRAESWTLRSTDPDCLFDGLRRLYRSGRDRMRAADRSRDPADVHDWRKANKYHGFHLDLLKRAAPEALSGGLDVVDKLSTILGEHHDCVVLRTAASHDHFPADADERARLKTLVGERMDHLERQAFDLGRQIFAEKPRALGRRIESYWTTA